MKASSFVLTVIFCTTPWIATAGNSDVSAVDDVTPTTSTFAVDAAPTPNATDLSQADRVDANAATADAAPSTASLTDPQPKLELGDLARIADVVNRGQKIASTHSHAVTSATVSTECDMLTQDIAADDQDLVGYIVGLKSSLSMVARAANPTQADVGVGFFAETELIHHWVELEATARIFVGEGDTHVPLELIFKKPFHLFPQGHVFLGVGPAAVVVAGGKKGGTHFGGVASLGTLLWSTPTVGFITEAYYSALDDHGLSHEFGLNIGIAHHL